MAKIIFFDLETTGILYWKHGVHQLSGIIEIHGVEVARFNYKVKPVEGAKIEPEALAIANVTLEQIMAYRPMVEVYAEFLALILKHVNRYKKTDKFFLIGYNNAAFDNNFLRAWFKQCGDVYFGSYFWPNPIDVYGLTSYLLMADRPKMEKFTLQAVAEKMGLPVDPARLHDALYDVELTRDVFKIFKGCYYTPKLPATPPPAGSEKTFIAEQQDDFLLPFDRPGSAMEK